MSKDYPCDYNDCRCVNSWCDQNNDSCNAKPNCAPKCCNPMECNSANIEQSHCVPIIAEKIFDCITLENLQYGESDTVNGLPIPVVIDNFDSTKMKSGMPICIDTVSTHIDFIGIPTGNLPFKIGTQSPINFVPAAGSGTLVTDYKVVLNTAGSCCPFGLGTSTKISNNTPIIFSGTNARVVITGKIGCTCFRGSYKAAGTFLINGNFAGIYPLNLFSKICLPSDQKTVTINLSFNPCLSLECVTPITGNVITVDAATGVATFPVSAEYSFLVKTEFTITTTDKLGVFVSNNDIVCKDSSGNSNCTRA